MRANLEEYCIRRGKPEILAQWDAARNAPLTPEDIPHSSREKVWWRCERGHAYRASIQSRVIMGSGCPVSETVPQMSSVSLTAPNRRVEV